VFTAVFGLFFFLFGASARFRAVASPISLPQHPLFLAAASQFVSGAKIQLKQPFYSYYAVLLRSFCRYLSKQAFFLQDKDVSIATNYNLGLRMGGCSIKSELGKVS
jgi:hypothetical protein